MAMIRREEVASADELERLGGTFGLAGEQTEAVASSGGGEEQQRIERQMDVQGRPTIEHFSSTGRVEALERQTAALSIRALTPRVYEYKLVKSSQIEGARHLEAFLQNSRQKEPLDIKIVLYANTRECLS
jgi:hypothetical protein